MKTILVIGLLLVFFVYWVVNALYMLISPQKWLHLPEWMVGRNMYVVKRCRTDEGIFEMRLLGAFFLIMAGLFLHGIVALHR
jgi:hypothetical protein